MSRPRNSHRIDDLRTQIADDLVSFRRGLPHAGPGPVPFTDLGQTAGRILRRYPAWVVAAVVGALAGVLVAARWRRAG